MLPRGTIVAGYQIDGVLGEGGMGVVYRATQLSLNRTVALKLLTGEMIDAGFRERFRREGHLQAAIDHPHIVTVYEAGETEHGLFLAMRLIGGATLKQLLSQELDARRSLRLLTQVAEALDAAHERGLIHRDVKPQNILVDARDQAYLADFGLTKEAGDSVLTETGQFVGTIDYVSPEQARGEAATGRSDVYALAGVLCECLSGQVPFPRQSESAVLYAHLTEPPPRVSERRAGLPAELDAVIAKGMAKDPSERQATAGELMLEATRAFAARTPAATTAPTDERPGGGPGHEQTRARTAAAGVTARGATALSASPAAATASPDADASAAAASPTRASAEPVGRATAPGQQPVAAAPPRRTATLVLLVALPLIAAVAAFAVSGSGRSTTSFADSASAGSIQLSFPAAWQRSSAQPQIPGISFSEPLALAPSTSHAAALVAGQVSAAGPTLLPSSFLALLPRAPTPSDPVRLGNLEAYRYVGLTPRGLQGTVTVYAVPTTAGVATVACTAGAGASTGVLKQCDQIAATLKLSGATPYRLGPSAAYASTLQATIGALNAARRSGGAKLSAARSPSAQTHAVRALGAAYRTASDTLARASVSPADRAANARMVAALARIADGYASAAAAINAGDGGAYRAATSAIQRGGTAAAQALAALGALGYRAGA